MHIGSLVKKKLKLTTVQFGCGCHIINLIVKKVLVLTAISLEKVVDNDSDNWSLTMENSGELIKRFQFMIKKSRNIASAFHQSHQMNESLAIAQSNMPHLQRKKIIKRSPIDGIRCI